MAEYLVWRLQVPDVVPNVVLKTLDDISVPVTGAEEELDSHVCTDRSSPCADGLEALEALRAIVEIKLEVNEDVGKVLFVQDRHNFGADLRVRL